MSRYRRNRLGRVMPRLLTVLLALLLFGSGRASADSDQALQFLPGSDTRPALWADGREPMSRVVARTGQTRIEAAIADGFVLLRYDAHAWAVQLGLASAGFLSFDPKGSLTFALMTFDGLVALPITITHGDLAHTVEWAHVSAHYADGIRGVLGYGEIDTGTYSREYMRWTTALQAGPWTPYVGARALIHTIPLVAPWGFQAGLQWDGGDKLPLFAAIDARAAAEHDWQGRWRGQVGGRFTGPRERGIQLGLECARGPDEKGKWEGREDAYCGAFLALEPR